ncbi:MAG: hypothetical protein K6T27_07765, partial [Thermoleophilum sp.]|nr:hypothetical protein [Thermoleophilum sp.]
MSGAGNPSLPPGLERYTRLLAERTKVMRSTAMRDLMSITERPEVISLAGGLPDTGSFPAPLFGRIFERIAREAVARALQYGPTEGLAETKRCVATVMAAEGMQVDPDDVLVTTGGQQVLDLVARTLIDPGGTNRPRAGVLGLGRHEGVRMEALDRYAPRARIALWPVVRALGALSLLAVGAVHLQQYLSLYSAIPTIGALFLLNFAGATAIGLGLLAPVERLLGRLGGP